MKKFKTNAKIVFNKNICEDYFLIKLYCPQIAQKAKPGQFVNIVCHEKGSDPFFRRPFDFHRIDSRCIEILYKTVGPGTKFLSEKKSGYLDIIGPLGKGFIIPKKNMQKKTIIILSGGIGVVPLLDVAEAVKKSPCEKIAILGARTDKLVFRKQELKKMGFKVKAVIDHKKNGKPIFAINYLEDYLKTYVKKENKSNYHVYSVGPQGMIAHSARVAKKFDINIQVSYEVIMGCGFGVCRGCNVDSIDGYQMVCQDGPVFDARKINDTRFAV